MKHQTGIRFLCISPVLLFWFSNVIYSQNFKRIDTIPVKQNGNWLAMPWVGGHNYCQFSEIDLNLDGFKDLFVFDRTGHKVSTYINKGTPNSVDYADSSSVYAKKFPHLEDWVLLRDYNCDGKADIFSYSNGGIRVWKNISSPGNLQFVLQAPFLKSTYCPSLLNLSITGVDIPSIDDIDNDGDLDILTYDAGGFNMQYHVNKSKELGYGCDSLIFNMDCGPCWGNYRTSISGCNVTLGTCRIMNPDSTLHREADLSNHAGNCSMCMDVDGDGDKEILLGQLGCCNMTLLFNGGDSSSAMMTSMDDSFPAYDIPAMFNSFPCGYFLDLNNDGKRDFLASPNAPNVSLDNSSIWYYLNTGTDKIPVFSRQTRNFLQKDMIDVGEGADPVFFDFDNDGLTDLLVSNYQSVIDSCPASVAYGIRAYKNIGTPTAPKFDLVNSDYANLSSIIASTSSKHPSFGDTDADADADMYVGDYDGFVHYFKNIALAGNPASYTDMGLVLDAVSSSPIDVGSYSTPQIIDVDRDGKADLLVGERSGNLNYYQNTGSTSSPSFSFVTASFGGIDTYKPCCTGYSEPFMYDSAGSYRLLIGSESSRTYALPTGWLWHYKNIDGNLAGNFTLTDSLYKNIWEGSRMMVHGADINNDGFIDLVIGNYSGGVGLYLCDTTAVSVNELHQPMVEFSVYPNPASGEINIAIPDLLRYRNTEFALYNSLGELVLVRNMFSASTRISISCAPGVYTCELRAQGLGTARKLLVIK